MSCALERSDLAERFDRVQQSLVFPELTACNERGDALELAGLPLTQRAGGEGDDGTFDDDQAAQTGIASFVP